MSAKNYYSLDIFPLSLIRFEIKIFATNKFLSLHILRLESCNIDIEINNIMADSFVMSSGPCTKLHIDLLIYHIPHIKKEPK